MLGRDWVFENSRSNEEQPSDGTQHRTFRFPFHEASRMVVADDACHLSVGDLEATILDDDKLGEWLHLVALPQSKANGKDCVVKEGRVMLSAEGAVRGAEAGEHVRAKAVHVHDLGIEMPRSAVRRLGTEQGMRTHSAPAGEESLKQL